MSRTNKSVHTELILNPIFLNSNFFRYLEDEQLKVIGAILTCKQYEQFSPTNNKFIAFLSGFDNEKKVENIKKSLIDIGLLKNDMSLDLSNWERRVPKL
ncbi:hypothetical protein N5912_02490 [Arcobacter lacus]|uniref:hypothetical protein n=1 Tax=Arcobacter lacus TaxID=1912876 RepID=UPI0021BB60AD|nr:hypothetical protein [Arcobacter lacus]MCT7910687.1 hypothetical protein [Arcobacter lacus]